MNVQPRKIILFAALFALAGCNARQAGPQPTGLRSAAPLLERSEAIRRGQSIRNPSYELTLDLTGDSQFSGRVKLAFEYRRAGAPLTIDFTGGTVETLLVNGRAQAIDYNGSFLSLAADSLGVGGNVIEIGFRQYYSRDGAGIYRFVDPQDQRVYLYTDLEPYAGNRVFPHFDQPDLKAKFTLAVLAPESWQVISTMRESGISRQGELRLWQFPQTLPFSSYVFSMHAGPFARWEDPDFRYPLRLFARQSLARYVQAEVWFDYTRNGFNFFEPWFGYDYPFLKYDQLLVPDFNSGAMENIAAVTFSENFITRSEYTRAEREDLANVIFHEMAHMWFGNISTMAWWDGLWLNESFASLMANLALASEPEFVDAWHSFFLGYKRWAYDADALVTTHPIQLPVPDTRTAETIFDGITYGKGSAVLKQLSFFVGEENFRRGIQTYIDASAFGNTDLEDFTGSLAKAADIDLDRWAQDWLYRAGFNGLETGLDCKAGKIESLSLKQTASRDHPTLRDHAVLLALFELNDGKLQLSHTLPVKIQGELTDIAAARGLDCPALVYPNYQDWGFLRVSLDQASLATVGRHMNDLRDPLQRSMLWQDLWSMVELAQLPLDDYLDIVHANLDGEREELVLSGILRSVGFGLTYFDLLGEREALRNLYGTQFEALIWRQMNASRDDVQRLWFDAYLAIASSDDALNRLRAILMGLEQPAGLTIDQDLRWDILVPLRRYRAGDSGALLAQERARDSSAEGVKRALQAQVIGASPEEKNAWLETALKKDDDFRLSNSRIIMRALYPSNQRHLLTERAAGILASLDELESQHDSLFFSHISRNLIPRLCTEKNVSNLSATIEDGHHYSPALSKALLVARQMDRRCIDIGARLTQPDSVPAVSGNSP